MKTKIQIKSIYGSILFEYEKENNSVRDTLLEAIKTNADLSYADMGYADMGYADMGYADMRCADMRCANLSGANLSCADMRCANLSGASLSGANLSGADLSGASANENTCMFFLQCPSEGSFIAWKKAQEKIVKLLVPEDAKRSSATTLKCRCSKAKVLAIENVDGSVYSETKIRSNKDASFIYTVGETVEVKDFDENRWNECSTGIHFFISREMAVNY